MATSFHSDDPTTLRPFLLSDAKLTGKTIGVGFYGSVEEVAIPGAVCAAKKIHNFFQDPSRISAEAIEQASKEFVRQCKLISTLRHPHIVQFLGVSFLPGSRLPTLVMEKLVTSLHEILDPEPPPPTKSDVPVGLKCSILHDVASGLLFLHNRKRPVVHGNLSARNVLLTGAMVAKIADLGMPCIVSGLKPATTTVAQGSSVYLPPEALEDRHKPNVTIDIFSFGVLALFTLSQTFPKPMPATYLDSSGRVIGRTELEQRCNCMQLVLNKFELGHPFVRIIQHCLSNHASERPTIPKVVQWLEQARAEVEDCDFDGSKLSLIQLLQSKDEQINRQQKKIETQKKQLDQNTGQIRKLKAQIGSFNEQIQFLKAESMISKVSLSVTSTMLLTSRASPILPVESLKWPFSFHWKKGKMGMCTYHCVHGFEHATTVVIDYMVYCSSKNEPASVAGYSIVDGNWKYLPSPPVVKFGMTSFNGQLVLAGGKSGRKYRDFGGFVYDIVESRITVWDSDREEWVHPYPPMPTARTNAVAVGHHKYLIVAGGDERIDEVEVFDSSTGQWQSAEPLLQEGQIMSTAVLDGCLYLYLNSGKITWVQLPTLVSCVDTTRSIWQSLSPPQTPPMEVLVQWGQHSVVPAVPPTPVPQVHCTLLAFRGHLLLIEGQKIHCYNKNQSKWDECGYKLPVQMVAPFFAVLPSGALLVGEGRPCRMWIGHAEPGCL